MFKNVPEVKMGIVAVSRSCFPMELSRKRKEEVLKASGTAGLNRKKPGTEQAQRPVLHKLRLLRRLPRENPDWRGFQAIPSAPCMGP